MSRPPEITHFVANGQLVIRVMPAWGRIPVFFSEDEARTVVVAMGAILGRSRNEDGGSDMQTQTLANDPAGGGIGA